MTAMAEIQELFAKLQGSASPGPSTDRQIHNPIKSPSPLKSPLPQLSQSQNVSTQMTRDLSNIKTGKLDFDSADQTANLLSLLRFNQSSQTVSASDTVRQTSQSQEQSADMKRNAAASISASDLVDQLTRNVSMKPSATVSSPSTVKPESYQENSSENPQDFLLKLLNTMPNHSESRSPTHVRTATQGVPKDVNMSPVNGAAEKETTPIRIFGSNEDDGDTPFEPPSVGPMFTYVNPFEQLSASSPMRRSPKQTMDSGMARSSTPKVEILKNKQESRESNKKPSSAASDVQDSVAQPASKGRDHLTKYLDSSTSFQSANRNTKVDQPASGLSTTAQVKFVAREEDTRGKEEDNANAASNEPSSKAANAVGTTKDSTGNLLMSSGEEQAYIKDEDAAAVRVYNFPMRPFVSIEVISLTEPAKLLRPSAALEIARLKKDFDQVDRNLVTATTNLIAYASSKSGGFRLIHQDSGRFKQVFQSNSERIFNISICRSIPDTGRDESVIATSTSGSVLWTKVTAVSDLDFESENLENKGIIIPPIPSYDDNSSSSQPKTRAKRSSRHPDFFAVGRGKSIYIIRPGVASQYLKSSKSRVVNMEKYLKERSMKIGTGKAGKDFTFSEDDTVIATLDKAGKLKFWDIRDLAQGSPENSHTPMSVEVSTPLLTLSTFSSNDKSWPTSVIFLDREKPITKGVALRYLVVGMKQNHTLQLWDIALGKAVQEIHFPHEKESDAICSFAYNARTNILVVGHPTRNSIYLIQVSAPKYNLPPMSQYTYIQRLACGLPGLPKPECTAIMNGIRELSMSPSNQLRSLDILSNPYPTSEDYDDDDITLFEIYTMHSRGVTCLRIKRKDLGWSKDGRTVNVVDAVTEKAISVKSLHLDSNSGSSEPLVNGEKVSQSPVTKDAKQPTRKETLTSRSGIEGSEATSKTIKAEQKHEVNSSALKNSTAKLEKKKKKRNEQDSEMPPDARSSPKRAHAKSGSSSAAAVEDEKQHSQNADEEMPSDNPDHVNVDTKAEQGMTSDEINSLDKLEKSITETLSRTLNIQLDNLYRKFEEDKRVQEAASAARQDAILRLVSSTLTDNVEKSLSRIVINSIQESVLPALSGLIKSSHNPKIFENMAGSLQSQIQRDIKVALPNAINRAMQEPEITKTISDLVSKRVAAQVDSHISNALNTTIGPHFTKLALTHIEKAIDDAERRTGEQIRQVERIQKMDNSKVDHLLGINHGLTESIQSLISAQKRLQEQVERVEQQLSTQFERTVPPHSNTSQTRSLVDEEIAAVDELFSRGNVVDGTIRWIQSNFQTELFDRYFCHKNPNYLKQLSQLLALSISAAVTVSMNTNILERLNWLETVFANLSPQDPEIIEVIPRIMDVLLNRLQRAYMEIAESDSAPNQVLKRITALVRRANELRSAAANK